VDAALTQYIELLSYRSLTRLVHLWRQPTSTRTNALIMSMKRLSSHFKVCSCISLEI